VGLAVLVALVARLGSEPFLAAVRGVDALALAAALAVGAVTTACCAWRWSVVAGALGDRLGIGTALAACYRSQLVNLATPGGVAGDVLRGVERAPRGGDRGLGLRSVLWERALGQGVQVALALAVLAVLPAPLPRVVVWTGALLVVAAIVVVLVRGRTRGSRTRWAEARAVVDPRVLRQAVPASALVVASLVVLFLVAARAAGSTAPTPTLVPLALVVLVGAAVPANLAGWGPREGVAAWAFGAAGLGTGTGLTTSVVFGVLVLAASLPGLAVLLWDATRAARRGPATTPARAGHPASPSAVVPCGPGASRG
jgi:hypothetical protein